MFSKKKSAKRFSLLLLEDEEDYVQDWMVTCRWPTNVDGNWQKLQQLSGRLRLCTKSMFFEPDDVRVPIVRWVACDSHAYKVMLAVCCNRRHGRMCNGCARSCRGLSHKHWLKQAESVMQVVHCMHHKDIRSSDHFSIICCQHRIPFTNHRLILVPCCATQAAVLSSTAPGGREHQSVCGQCQPASEDEGKHGEYCLCV